MLPLLVTGGPPYVKLSLSVSAEMRSATPHYRVVTKSGPRSIGASINLID
jgi:hypothetical protein